MQTVQRIACKVQTGYRSRSRRRKCQAAPLAGAPTRALIFSVMSPRVRFAASAQAAKHELKPKQQQREN